MSTYVSVSKGLDTVVAKSFITSMFRETSLVRSIMFLMMVMSVKVRDVASCL